MAMSCCCRTSMGEQLTSLWTIVVNIWWYIMVYNGIWMYMMVYDGMVIWPSYSWSFNDWFHWDPVAPKTRILGGLYT
jgi:hypothetical protein